MFSVADTVLFWTHTVATTPDHAESCSTKRRTEKARACPHFERGAALSHVVASRGCPAEKRELLRSESRRTITAISRRPEQRGHNRRPRERRFSAKQRPISRRARSHVAHRDSCTVTHVAPLLQQTGAGGRAHGVAAKILAMDQPRRRVKESSRSQ